MGWSAQVVTQLPSTSSHALGYHLVIAAVAAVLTAHRGKQIFGGEAAGGVAGHDLRAGAARRTGVRGELGVVHDKTNLLGLIGPTLSLVREATIPMTP